MKSSVSNVQEFWRRAWLRELGVEWRGPLPDSAPQAATAHARDSISGSTTNRPPPVAETGSEATDSQPEAVIVPASGLSLNQEASPASADSRSVEPIPSVPVRAENNRPAWRLTGGWRWSWWRGEAAVKQALLLRPADAPRHTDAAARDLLAAAMAAVGLTPVPRDRERPMGGVTGELDEKTLRNLATQPWRPLVDQSLTVIVCLAPRMEHELARQSGIASAVPGDQWQLPGQPALRLVLLPSPERMLEEGATAKRVAWRALAPLQQGV
ncbi:MAG: hypothetical protein AB7E55_22590 [Pigmentiphaga sp.]